MTRPSSRIFAVMRHEVVDGHSFHAAITVLPSSVPAAWTALIALTVPAPGQADHPAPEGAQDEGADVGRLGRLADRADDCSAQRCSREAFRLQSESEGGLTWSRNGIKWIQCLTSKLS
jgi:hypothetical protein